MEHLLALLCLMMTSPAFAVTWNIQGPCDPIPSRKGEAEVDLNESWGKITLRILNQEKIPFKGDEEGMVSIQESPVGMDAIEIVSQTTIRAYGWCYSVNGEIPDRLPHELKPGSQQDQLTWFYAFSTNRNNEWVDYCVPAHSVRSEKLCPRRR